MSSRFLLLFVALICSSNVFAADWVPNYWTIMVYLDADNNLESDGLADFLEMASVPNSSTRTVVVQMDRAAPPHSPEYGGWSDTRRFVVKHGDTPASPPVKTMGELNMGDPATLQDFVEWAMKSYPAYHYMLVIWNHGGGWRKEAERVAVESVRDSLTKQSPPFSASRAVAWDSTNGNDALYMREVQDALERAVAAARATMIPAPITGQPMPLLAKDAKLDIVGFDACLMGMVEVSYALRNVAQYVVASEDLEPGAGWSYDSILADMSHHPGIAARDLTGIIVKDYVGSTMSAVDLSELTGLTSSIDALTALQVSNWGVMHAARDHTASFGIPPDGIHRPFADLGVFAEQVSKEYSTLEPAIAKAADNLRASIGKFVVHESHASGVRATGVSIYFPSTRNVRNLDPDRAGYRDSNAFMPVDFVRDHQWDNWLENYYANVP